MHLSMMRTMFGVMAIVALSRAHSQSTTNMKLLAVWNDLEYIFPSDADRDNAIARGYHVAGTGFPIDVDVDYKATQTRIFVTVPRFSAGIPITLGYINGARGNGGPAIHPYPNYAWQNVEGTNCDGLTSVFRVAVDECKRLWVLDTGRVGENFICGPQLLVFDLGTDQLIHRYKIPGSQIRLGSTLLITPIVNVGDPPPAGQCANTMVYMADVTGFGIIVYSSALNRSWRVQNKLIFPHPKYGTFTIAGESFDLMDGPLGMALSPRNQKRSSFFPTSNDQGRILYFHALASATENAVATNVLNNATLWDGSVEATPRSFVEIGTRSTQSAAEAMDRNGNLFFGLMNPIAIACWDSSTPYNRNNIKIVAENDATLQFASGLKIVTNTDGQEELWVITGRLQRFMTGTMDRSEPNFRIQVAKVSDLLGGSTKCEVSKGSMNSLNFPRQ